MKKFLSVVFILSFFFFISLPPKTFAKIETSGDLQVSYEEPLFPAYLVWYPGFSITKSFSVKNLGSSTYTVYIKATNTSQTGNIADVFLFKVREGNNVLSGQNDKKTLKNFWDEGQIFLSEIKGGEVATYEATITMLTSAGNEYQGKQAMFDLIIGFKETANQVVIDGGSQTGVTNDDRNHNLFSPNLSPKPISNLIVALSKTVLGSSTGEAKLTTDSAKILKAIKPEKIKGERIFGKHQAWFYLFIVLGGLFLLFLFLIIFSLLKSKRSQKVI